MRLVNVVIDGLTTKNPRVEFCPSHSVWTGVQRWEVAVDGWLADSAALSRLLGLSPSASMSEILVQAWLRWGLEIGKRLDGEYAFVIWNERDEEVLVARDLMGCRSLYVGQTGTKVVICSELSRTASAILARPSPAAIATQLSGMQSSPALTLFENVREVEAGETRLFRRGAWTTGRRVLPSMSARPLSPREGQLALRAAIAQAVRPHVGAGVLFSGGVDSSCVALEASKFGDPLLVTYRVDEPQVLKESRVAIEVAQRLGLRQVLLTPTSGCLATPYAPVLHGLRDGWREVRATGTRVLLTGHGADHFFGWRPRLKWWSRTAVARRAQRLGLRRTAALMGLERASPGLLTPSSALCALLTALEWTCQSDGDAWLGVTDHRLLSKPLAIVDRVFAGADLDVRHPWLSRPVLDVVSMLSASTRTEGGRPKAFLQAAFPEWAIAPAFQARKRNWDAAIREVMGLDRMLVRELAPEALLAHLRPRVQTMRMWQVFEEFGTMLGRRLVAVACQLKGVVS